MDPILQLNEFFVDGGDQEKSHVLLHITEPSTPEERKKGHFFAVAELNQVPAKNIELFQTIIDEIENKYYEVPDIADKNSLEVVLEEINQLYQNLASKMPGLSCVVGAIRQREIMFSYYGRPALILFYKNKQALYQKMNLIETGAPEGGEEKQPLFSQLIQGKISPNDFLFVGTPHIHDYFNTDRLQKIITSKTAQQSAEHIERVLSDIQGGLSFGGLVIHLRSVEAVPSLMKRPRPVEADGSKKSLSNLFITGQHTADTLSPTLLRGMSDKFKSMFPAGGNQAVPTDASAMRPETLAYPETEINAAHAFPHRSNKPEPKRQGSRDGLLSLAKLISMGFKLLGKAILTFIIIVWQVCYGFFLNLVLIFIVLVNYQDRRRNIVDDWKRQWQLGKEFLYHLPLLTKILLAGSLSLGLVFFGSLWYLRLQQSAHAAATVYTQTLETIKTKQDAAESALIYKNEDVALTNIHTAEQLIATLPCKSKDQKATCQSLTDKLTDLLARARRVTIVTATRLTTVNPQLLKHVLRINNKLIGFSETTSTLYVYDLLSREGKIVATIPSITGFLSAASPKENDYALFLYNKKDLVRFNPADYTTKLIDVSYPSATPDIASVVVYNRRLYTIDRAANQIYKHETTQLGFGPGKLWLKNNSIDIRSAVATAVDGDVFVLGSDGVINKFTSGVGTPLPISGLDPALKNGDAISTYTDVQNIYVLDSSMKRLLVADKDGHLLKQITAREFVNPTGLIVDEANATAYITDSGNLYKIALPK